MRAAAWVPVAAGTGVAVTLGVYGRFHEPPAAADLAGFLPPLTAKVWLATGAVALAVVQLLSALAMYGRLPRVPVPSWTPALHRWSGRAAFLLSLPVAVHCLYAFGLHAGGARVLLHGLAGCLVYGAFVTKMLTLGRPGAAGWTLPLAGGVLFTALTGAWLTSALWYFAS